MPMVLVLDADRLAEVRALDLGDPFGPGFPLQSPLRSDFRCNPYRLRELRSLRAPLAKKPDRPCRRSAHRARFNRPVLAPALRAALAASRSASASRAGAPVVALPASPVRASPVTGLRTSVRTTAGATADASGSVLRTTAAGAVRGRRHSIAVAAPIRRVLRRRFPIAHTARFAVPYRPGRLFVHTRRIDDAGRAIGPYVRPFRGLSGSSGVLRLLDRVYALGRGF